MHLLGFATLSHCAPLPRDRFDFYSIINFSAFWQNVERSPPDAILGLTEAYLTDENASKVNLGVGTFRTDDQKPLVLECVKNVCSSLFFGPTLPYSLVAT